MIKICKKRVGSARAGGSSKGETGRQGGGQGVSSGAAFTSDSRSAQSGQVPRTDAAQTSSLLSIFFFLPQSVAWQTRAGEEKG